MVKNEQQLTLDILLDVYENKGYSNLSLNKLLPKGKMSNKNGFITAVVYGVIERDLTLEYIINMYSKKKCDKLDVEIVLILKMALYQLLYMNSIKDNAVVNECVKLCHYKKKVSAKGFVNGILRSFIRDGKKIVIKEKDDIKSLSIAYSCPESLIKKWCNEYSYDIAKSILKASIGRPPLTIRVNTLKTDIDSLIELLSKKDIKCEKISYLDNCLNLSNTKSLEKLKEFNDGLFYVQDLSSQFCAYLVNAKPNDTFFDLCSAPGSKSFTVAQYMQNKGKILSFDLYEHKLELIEKTAHKLEIDNITVLKSDASVYNEKLGLADCVLCDVPCAGLGIIRRKPEIKYKSLDDIKDLPIIQKKILQNGSRYVKKGGRLIYSTCSLNICENQNVAKEFLDNNKDFKPVDLTDILKDKALVENNMATFLPHFMDSDGFFVAVFEKI